MAKSNRTNRDRPTDDSADIQPDAPGTDAADLPLDDDLVTDLDSLPGNDNITADSGDATGAAESASEDTGAADSAPDDADDDAEPSPLDDSASTDKESPADEDAADADGEKTSKDTVTPAAKPAGRNRKAAGGASTGGGRSTSTKSSSSKKTATTDAKSSAKSGNPAKRAANRKTASYTSTPGTQTIKPNGRWFVPTMVTVLLLGLAWLVVFYISSGAYPVGAWGYWNLGVGFAILVAGLVMSTRWR